MTTHNLNAYKDGHTWITYCKLCGLEADQLLGSQCAGKVESIVKEGVDKTIIDAYVNRMIAANSN